MGPCDSVQKEGRLFVCLFVFSKNTSCICLAHAGSVVTPCQRDLTLKVIYPWNNSGFWCLCWILTFLSEKQNCCGRQYTPACVFICSGECITAQTACIRLASADFIRWCSPIPLTSHPERATSATQVCCGKLPSVNLQCEKCCCAGKRGGKARFFKKPKTITFQLPHGFE